jgi:perosamine synthetase
MERISVAGPWITQKEIDYVTDAVSNAWFSNANLYHGRFESAFAAYVGRVYAIALPSCTSALHLALLSLDVGPGDEVIVPDITWIASAAPIHYVRATPVFADVDAESWCLSIDSLRDRISSRTKAVIVVNLYGNMPDMGPLLDLARQHDIAVIEDAAESVGSEYNGRKAGSFGLFSTFSFHASKTLVTGEGGMLLTDDEDHFRRSLFLRDHGRHPGDKSFWNSEIGYKYKMSSMQAALGLAQLERIDELVERKREIFGWYAEELVAVEGITLNHEGPGIKNTYWMVTVIVDGARYGIHKTELISKLSEQGIDCRPFFHPLSSLPAYADSPHAETARARNRIAYAMSPYGVNLPSGFNMTRSRVAYVSERVRALLAERGAVKQR